MKPVYLVPVRIAMVAGAGALAALASCVGDEPAGPAPARRSLAAATAIADYHRTEPQPADLVTLSWSDLATGGVADLPLGTITLEVTNVARVPLELDLAISLVEAHAPRATTPTRMTLRAGERRVLPIDLFALGVGWSSLRTPVQIIGHAEVHEAAGDPPARARSALIYLHQDPASGLLRAYGEDQLAAFGAGDLLGLFPRHPTRAAGIVVDGGPGLFTADQPAPDEHRFCLKYRVSVVDYGVGEDYHDDGDAWVFYPSYQMVDGLWTAHGAAYDLYDPALGAWVTGQHAGVDDGCFDYASPATEGFVIRLYARARVSGDNEIRGYADNDAGEVFAWDIAADPGPTGSTHIYFTPGGHLSTVMGVATWTAHRMAELAPANLQGRTLDAVADLCGPMPSYGSCYLSTTNTLWIHPPGFHNGRKFLIAHEVGHWVEDQWGGQNLTGGSYSYDDDVLACAFDGPGDHALRSREQASRAYKEGLAHFLSTLAFNDPEESNAWFEYYKRFPEQGYDERTCDVAAEQADPLGGTVDWNFQVCLALPSEGYAVEQDWLRFLWDYLTDDDHGPPLPLDELATLVGDAQQPAMGAFDAYSRLTAAVPPAQLDRWTDLALAHGVAVPE